MKRRPRLVPLPAPTRAVHELPDEGALAGAGITGISLEMARIILVVLSRFICSGKSSFRLHVYDALCFLRFVGHRPFEYNGRRSAPPHPDLAKEKVPSGKTVMESRLKITKFDLDEYWVTAEERADDACLPLEWALAFVPAPFWPLIASFIEWGPALARARMLPAVTIWSRRRKHRRDHRRPRGARLGQRRVDSVVHAVRRLSRAIEQLRSDLACSEDCPLALELIEHWQDSIAAIDSVKRGAQPANIDVSGPGFEVLAEAIRRHAYEYRRILASHGTVARFRPLRDLIILCVMVLFCPRAAAFIDLDVDDYDPHRPFLRGAIHRPALRFYPDKNVVNDFFVWMPLPDVLAQWIEDYITETRRVVGQKNAPFLITALPTNPQENCSCGDPKGCEHVGRRMSLSNLQDIMSGSRPNRAQPKGRKPLVVRHADRPYDGYNTYAYRHSMYELAQQAGVQHLAERGASAPGRLAKIHYARAMCVHDMGEVTHQDINAEELRLAVVDRLWPRFYIEGCRELGRDPEAITAAARARNRLAAELTTVLAKEEELRRTVMAAAHRVLEEREVEQAVSGGHALLGLVGDERRDLETRLAEAEQTLTSATETLVGIPFEFDPIQYRNAVDRALTVARGGSDRELGIGDATGEEPLDGLTREAAHTGLRALVDRIEVKTRADRAVRVRDAIVCAIWLLYAPPEFCVRRLNIGDYDPAHEFGPITRPALRVYLGLWRQPETAVWLPIPGEVDSWLRDYIFSTGRTPALEDAPLLISRRPKEPADSCHCGPREDGCRHVGTRLGSYALHDCIAGAQPTGTGGGRRSMLPRDASAPLNGFAQEDFRSAVRRWASAAAAEFIWESEAAGAPPVYLSETLARAFSVSDLRSAGGTDIVNGGLMRASLVDICWRRLWHGTSAASFVGQEPDDNAELYALLLRRLSRYGERPGESAHSDGGCQPYTNSATTSPKATRTRRSA